jgi:GTP cyclohydrolase IA
MPDQNKIKLAMATILEALGDGISTESRENTPLRVAEMYEELFAGMTADPAAELSIGFEEGHYEMVILRDIPFYSMCEHHFLPFYGVAHVGYVPRVGGKIVGVSKLARVVEIFARRPQLQERMTKQIADAIFETLNPEGVGVIIQAEHLCMTMRGIKKPGTNAVTSAVRGTFRSKSVTRSEFLSLIQGK